MPLYRKPGGNIIQVGGALAGGPNCCCDTQTDHCFGATENCAGGVAPINMNATVVLTDAGGNVCSPIVLAEGNGTHALTLTHPAVFESGSANLEPTGCVPFTSYNIPGQCRWTWTTFHTFAPSGGCDIGRVSINVSLYEFADGYRLFGSITFDRVVNHGTIFEAYFTSVILYARSAVLDIVPIDCVNDLGGVVLSFVCRQFSGVASLTGLTITISIP